MFHVFIFLYELYLIFLYKNRKNTLGNKFEVTLNDKNAERTEKFIKSIHGIGNGNTVFYRNPDLFLFYKTGTFQQYG